MALDPNRWTLKTQEAIQATLDSARARNHAEATPEHLLLALLGQEEGVVLPILQRIGVAPLTLRNRLEDALGKVPRAYGGSEVGLSRDLRDVIEAADTERTGLGDEYLSTEHLLLVMADRVGSTKEQVVGGDLGVAGGARRGEGEVHRLLGLEGPAVRIECHVGGRSPVTMRSVLQS